MCHPSHTLTATVLATVPRYFRPSLWLAVLPRDTIDLMSRYSLERWQYISVALSQCFFSSFFSLFFFSLFFIKKRRGYKDATIILKF